MSDTNITLKSHFHIIHDKSDITVKTFTVEPFWKNLERL